MLDFESVIEDITDELLEFRHDLHAHPETAYEEKRTAARVVAGLSKLPNLRITSDIAGHSFEVELQVVEVLGSETFAHFDLPVRPVVTPDIEELLADSGSDASSLGDSTRVTARISSDVMVRAGERITVVVDNNKLHFFDPATNLRIY